MIMFRASSSEFAAKVIFIEKKKNQTNTTFKLFVKVVFESTSVIHYFEDPIFSSEII